MTWSSLNRLFARSLSYSTQTTKSCTLSQLASQLRFKAFPENVQRTALAVEQARKNKQQIENLKAFQALVRVNDDVSAYDIAGAATALRIEDGEIPVGRKFGFTNTNIWPEYGIDAPNWGYMYSSTVTDLEQKGSTSVVDISFATGLEPKIEPEIVFKIARQPSKHMNEAELLACMEWVGHGFEIVQSIFPGWKFTGPYTTAAGALHGHLFIGPTRLMLDSDSNVEKIVDQLNNMKFTLFKNEAVADIGKGTNVLGGPLKALKHIITLLDDQSLHPCLSPGEVITTGTLTKALSVERGGTWRTELQGITGLNGLEISFKS